MQVASQNWSLAVAAGTLQQTEQNHSETPCSAAARHMVEHARVEFVKTLGSLYLAAKTQARRDAVIAVDPALFQSFARQSGHSWSPARAGFAAPMAGEGLGEFCFDHEDFGPLVCHLGVCDDDFYLQAAYLGAREITHRLSDQEQEAVVAAYNKYLELENFQHDLDRAAARVEA